jgi:hypothetical protein
MGGAPCGEAEVARIVRGRSRNAPLQNAPTARLLIVDNIIASPSAAEGTAGIKSSRLPCFFG